MKIVGIIPARYGSTRFPGKPLIEIKGKKMIERVWEQANKAEMLDKVIVATDDERILQACMEFGGDAVMTSTAHPTGTDRCAEVLSLLEESYDYVLNVQGDEPFIDPIQINNLAKFISDGEMDIATLAMPLRDQKKLFNENVVKVVRDRNNRAMYFSRQPIPHIRGLIKEDWIDSNLFFKHIGMYAFRSEVLKALSTIDTAEIERAESLEQLRWLYHGYSIGIMETSIESFSVDTPDDLHHI